MRKRLMSFADVQKLLQQEVDRAGSQSAWAKQFGFDHFLCATAVCNAVCSLISPVGSPA